MAPPRFHPRSDWVTTKPVTGPAPTWGKLDTAVPHYTAASNLPSGDPGERSDDVGIAAYIRNIHHSYLADPNRGYSIGYSFAIDWRGDVWELRGWTFKPAANLNHNDHTLPTLFLVDADDPANEAQLAAARWLFGDAETRVGRKLAIVGHGQLPGAATSCPGNGIKAQIAAGAFNPRPSQPLEDDDMVPVNFRAWDSRDAGPRIRSGEWREVPIPYASTKAELNVTVLDHVGAGYLAINDIPAESGTSVINFEPGQGIKNNGLTFKVNPDGKLYVGLFGQASAEAHVILDAFQVG
jgi:hypothetical protein